MSGNAHEPSCLFCKIVRGDIPSSKVLETEDAIAFLDIHPVNKGHVLVVPKHHHPHLVELPEALAAHVGSILPRLCRAVQAATGADGFNVIINNGTAAGQTVDHGHWHIIPRFHDDPVEWPWPHSEYVGDELGQMRFRIERELRPNPNDD
ncbi:HIT family protein [Singulisphaera sp. PoT]|uniref:HIT family protein n=1 Tax=Singulisphaera sp. PoT TaxID=3411797 RepID=UPI003BF50404